MTTFSPQTQPDTGKRAPVTRHVLYEYDGPKLTLAVDDQGRQVLGVFADEIVHEISSARVERWLFAPATPSQVIALLEGRTSLRAIFTQEIITVMDMSPEGPRSWDVRGASLPDDLLPDPDASLPELTQAFRTALFTEQFLAMRARTALMFDGRPVIGTQGISATFAASALLKYQELVSIAYGNRRGSLGATGPIPRKHESMLHIVDMPRGSVGFALEELAEPEVVAPTELAEVVSEVGALIDAAATDDQQLADIAGGFESRVMSALRDLFSLLNKSEATLRLTSNDRAYRFDAERIKMAVERTTSDIEEVELDFRGILQGYLPSTRQFELLDDHGALIKGRVGRGLNMDELKPRFEMPCVARMRVVTVRRGGRSTHAFTMLSIAAPPG